MMESAKVKVYRVPKYHLVAGGADKGDVSVVLADDAYLAVKENRELWGALEETLERIRDFREWYEVSQIHPDEDELMNAIARLGLTGRAEATLDKYAPEDT